MENAKQLPIADVELCVILSQCQSPDFLRALDLEYFNYISRILSIPGTFGKLLMNEGCEMMESGYRLQAAEGITKSLTGADVFMNAK